MVWLFLTYPDFMTFGEEAFVDAGCKDLSTSWELTQYCNHVKKMYAFNPDDGNYHDCIKCKAEFTETDAVVIGFIMVLVSQ